MNDAPEPVIIYTKPPSRTWIYIAVAMSFLTIGIFVATTVINSYAPLVGPPSVVQVDAQPVHKDLSSASAQVSAPPATASASPSTKTLDHTDPPSAARDAGQQVAEADPPPVPELAAGGATKVATLPLDTTGRLERTIKELAADPKPVADPPQPPPAAEHPAPAQVSAPPVPASPSTKPTASAEVQKWEKLMTAWYEQKQLGDQIYQWCQQPKYQAMGFCRK